MSIVLKNAPYQQGYYTIPDLPVFRLRCTLPITAEVGYIHNGKVYNIFTSSYVPGVDDYIEISFNDVLQTLFSSEEPIFHLSYFSQYNLLKEIYVLFKDDDGQVERTFNILNMNAHASNIASILPKRFLTSQPNVKVTTVDSPEFLTYFNISGIKSLVAQFYNSSGEISDIITLCSINAVGACTYNVSYSFVTSMLYSSIDEKKTFYDIYVVDETGQRISEVQRYVFKEASGNENYYLFYNSFGGLDTLTTSGPMHTNTEISFDIARCSDGLKQLENPDDHIVYKQNSGQISADCIPFVKDFISSKRDKYIYDGLEFIKITITEAEGNFNCKKELNSFEFSYRKMDDVQVFDDINIDQELIVENIFNQTPKEAEEDTKQYGVWINHYAWDNGIWN